MSHSTPKFLTTLALLGAGLALAGVSHADGPPAAAACAGCHGADGNSTVTTFPKLAGQQQVYLLRELKDYKSGKRASEIMAPFMADLSEANLEELATWYAKQKPAPGVKGDPALLKLGKALYMNGNNKTDVPACASCHEDDGSGYKKFARVAGQHVEYTLEQFRLYASGKRSNGARVMQTVAERMTEQETRAVAEYMASMP
ncbi:MAG: c-type cytochrome [Pseudomonadota bacterium]|nr:c-type cytochrome [Pseudomonadota bacterium]MDP1902777.1 c-type cytochrome [Pseudomonadota bacterium]MDP2351011.1 c-type cytochrome [Pseudomonadota bacterium]